MSGQSPVSPAKLTERGAVEIAPRMRERLDAAHLKARTMSNAPFQTFDRRYNELVHRAGGQSAAAQVAILTEGAEYFEAMADPAQWPTTRHAEEQAHLVATLQAAAGALPGVSFDPVKMLLNLRSRGVSITLDAAGKIVAMPASALNAMDRDQLRHHRADIVAALQDRETF